MIKKAIALLLLIGTVVWSFKALMPSNSSDIDTDRELFSTARALVHLEAISQQPHAVGTEAHTEVRNYIIAELQKLGIETSIQEGFSMTGWGNLAKPKNILGRLKGTESGKALMLLTHYDSAPHSSLGASDAGSGVVTILEGLRAFLHSENPPKNDIIILITDAEELGLNGADLFVNKHPWAKDVGLVLNFEARGSGGSSYMLIETNQGNSKLIKEFVTAAPKFPVANSLAYSIYKKLPNDTDLTRFREDADIDGFNFAFIDDHFDYHTEMDNYERLNRNTLEHQGHYMMPLLTHFSQADLSDLKSEDNVIYFNAPMVKTVTYPFSWIWPILILAMLLFGALVIYGYKQKRLNVNDMLKGFLPFLGSLILSGVGAFLIWKYVIVGLCYPEYNEILHGFTYNGKSYIMAFTFLSLGTSFWMYSKFYKPANEANNLIAPLFVWLLICLIIAIELEGASFFIIPVFFGLLSLFVMIRRRKPGVILMALLALPLLMIISPFVEQFAVGLGLRVLFLSCILVVLIFGLLQSVFSFLRHQKRWAYLCLFLSLCFFIKAHFKSNFNEERPKPNSLVYVLDIDNNKAEWATYDRVLDDWTKRYFDNNQEDSSQLQLNIVGSKYNSGFTYTKRAPLNVLLYPEIDIYKDTIIDQLRHVSIYIAPKRKVNRMELFADTLLKFHDFTINGIEAYRSEDSIYAFANRRSNRLFSYFVTNNEPIDMSFSVPKDQLTTMTLYESSNDLLTNDKFGVPKRDSDMIPKPFVLNDAVIIKKTIKLQ